MRGGLGGIGAAALHCYRDWPLGHAFFVAEPLVPQHRPKRAGRNQVRRQRIDEFSVLVMGRAQNPLQAAAFRPSPKGSEPGCGAHDGEATRCENEEQSDSIAPTHARTLACTRLSAPSRHKSHHFCPSASSPSERQRDGAFITDNTDYLMLDAVKMQYLPSPLVVYLLSAGGSSPVLLPVNVSQVVETVPHLVRLLMVAESP